MTEKTPQDRLSDGFVMEVDGVVDFDSESEFYGTKSKVGGKLPPQPATADAKPRARITKDKRAKLRKLGFTQ